MGQIASKLRLFIRHSKFVTRHYQYALDKYFYSNVEGNSG